MPVKQKTLIAALDWGLGHATRLVPIVRESERNGEEVLLASAGKAFDFWKEYFPHLVILKKPGYRIKYPKNGSMMLSIFFQLPRIIGAIVWEYFWLKKIVRHYEITKVVSDNCYGLWNRKVKSIFITHQLNVIVPGRNSFISSLVNKTILFFVKKYDECLVPDLEGAFNFSGMLSHLKNKPQNVKYIGLQSRFENDQKILSGNSFDLLVILSGPEPQRSLLENWILNILKFSTDSCCILRGIPGEGNSSLETLSTLEKDNGEGIIETKNIVWYNHVDDQKLKSLLINAKKVVCRSGYSTIMDLATLNVRALLIPTPGQTEQEYLAEYNMDKKLFTWIPQDKLSIYDLLEDRRSEIPEQVIVPSM